MPALSSGTRFPEHQSTIRENTSGISVFVFQQDCLKNDQACNDERQRCVRSKTLL
jgi:hypothetical protein